MKITTIVGMGVVLIMGFSGSNALATPGPFVPPVQVVSDGGAYAPSLVLDPDGKVTAYWYQDEGFSFATKPQGGTFGTAGEIAPYSEGFKYATANDGTTAVAWSADGLIRVATRSSGGQFGAPVSLSPPDDYVYSFAVSVAPDGTTTVAWMRVLPGETPFDPTHFLIEVATREPSGSFGLPAVEAVLDEYPRDLAMTAGGDGSTTIVWSSNTTMRALTRPKGGSFGQPQDISAQGEGVTIRTVNQVIQTDADDAPHVITAGDGTTIVYWVGSKGGDNVVRAVMRPQGGSFGPVTEVSPSSPNSRAVMTPDAASVPKGDTVLVWQYNNGGSNVVQTATRTAGKTFGKVATLSEKNPSYLEPNPQVAAGSDGSFIGVWASSKTGGTIQTSIRPPGKSFQDPLDIADHAGPKRSYPDAVITPKEATVAWSQKGDGGTQIRSVSTGKPGRQNLRFISKPTPSKKSGKVVLKVKVKNIGTAMARSLKVCAKAPKKRVGKLGCDSLNSLKVGATKKAKFVSRLKKSARNGKKIKVKLVATGDGVVPARGKATVKVARRN